MRSSLTNKTSIFGIMGGLYNRKISGRSSMNRVTSRLAIPASAKEGYQYMKMHNLLSRNPLGSGGVGKMFRLRAGGSSLGSSQAEPARSIAIADTCAQRGDVCASYPKQPQGSCCPDLTCYKGATPTSLLGTCINAAPSPPASLTPPSFVRQNAKMRRGSPYWTPLDLVDDDERANLLACTSFSLLFWNTPQGNDQSRTKFWMGTAGGGSGASWNGVNSNAGFMNFNWGTEIAFDFSTTFDLGTVTWDPTDRREWDTWNPEDAKTWGKATHDIGGLDGGEGDPHCLTLGGGNGCRATLTRNPFIEGKAAGYTIHIYGSDGSVMYYFNSESSRNDQYGWWGYSTVNDRLIQLSAQPQIHLSLTPSILLGCGGCIDGYDLSNGACLSKKAGPTHSDYSCNTENGSCWRTRTGTKTKAECEKSCTTRYGCNAATGECSAVEGGTLTKDECEATGSSTKGQCANFGCTCIQGGGCSCGAGDAGIQGTKAECLAICHH
jgi:hypothetical protein